MARGVNKVIIIGNLGQDPEVRMMPSGNPVANLRIATTDSWMDKQSGQRQERTEWHSVVLFNKLAEIAQQYVKKGSRIYIEGRLQTRKWQDQSGQDRYTTEIVGNDMQMLDSRGQQGGHQQGGGYQQQGGSYGGAPQGGQQAPAGGGYQQGASQPQGNYGAPPQGYGGQAPQGAPPQQPTGPDGRPDTAQRNEGPPPNAQQGNFDDFDDEIPF